MRRDRGPRHVLDRATPGAILAHQPAYDRRPALLLAVSGCVANGSRCGDPTHPAGPTRPGGDPFGTAAHLSVRVATLRRNLRLAEQPRGHEPAPHRRSNGAAT